MNILKKVIDMLANDEILPDKYRDHLLIGNYKGKHECHIEPDWLLIYEYLEDELFLQEQVHTAIYFNKKAGY